MVEHSRANFVVVEDKEQLDKVFYDTTKSRKLYVEVAMICIQIWGVRDELEHLVEVVQWDGKVILLLDLTFETDHLTSYWMCTKYFEGKYYRVFNG